jgi:hypothetical protein
MKGWIIKVENETYKIWIHPNKGPRHFVLPRVQCDKKH